MPLLIATALLILRGGRSTPPVLTSRKDEFLSDARAHICSDEDRALASLHRAAENGQRWAIEFLDGPRAD